MKRKFWVIACLLVSLVFISATQRKHEGAYFEQYESRVDGLDDVFESLIYDIKRLDLKSKAGVDYIRKEINNTRKIIKQSDFWLRYLEPTVYKQINGPLAVEWETEVFEKFEKPYKREGAGLTLAWLCLEEENPDKEKLIGLVRAASKAARTYWADSITKQLEDYQHFFMCNRLYLLNLASIYTTGFECPDTSAIIPELKLMAMSVHSIYKAYNADYPATALKREYMELYWGLCNFVTAQPVNYRSFDHFTFIRDYVNPLFSLNQKMILEYNVSSKSVVDYSLSKTSASIFSKSLYTGQNKKGVFLRVTDEKVLADIVQLGKMLFYDPILSGNNQRSCASCHKPAEYFADTSTATSLQFDHRGFLARNTPSLLNVGYNHLIMLDGRHISLNRQARAVITDEIEMGSDEKECLKKVLSCKSYKRAFKKLLKYTPQETEVTFDHVISAIVFYYSKFSNYDAPFDQAMNNERQLDADTREGFNLFMGKAQCATCHFVPQFNGVKPPYVGSEFEVLGVPADTGFSKLSPDQGRYTVHPAAETMNAFRTGTIRNSSYTAPYMHNGVFRNLSQVIDFYNAGGGAGRGLKVDNQTLSADSLGLTASEKLKLIAFIKSLDETISFEQAPESLPKSSDKVLNRRKVGGEY